MASGGVAITCADVGFERTSSPNRDLRMVWCEVALRRCFASVVAMGVNGVVLRGDGARSMRKALSFVGELHSLLGTRMPDYVRVHNVRHDIDDLVVMHAHGVAGAELAAAWDKFPLRVQHNISVYCGDVIDAPSDELCFVTKDVLRILLY